MQLVLEILDGELKGARYAVREGLTIGRRESDITLQDSKVSGKHAEIRIRPPDEVWLTDLGSSNGIKFDGNRVLELRLALDMEFTLGKTRFRVTTRRSQQPKAESDRAPAKPQGQEPARPRSTKEKVAPSQDPIPDSRALKKDQSPAPAEAAAEEKAAPVERSWEAVLGELLDRAARASSPSKKKIAPFHQTLHLKFIRGVQTGAEWTIGYGPRESGSGSLDLPLEEPGLPPICFRLFPQHDAVLFKAAEPDLIRINGQPVESAFLRDGDVIEINNTRIAVELGASSGNG